MAWRTSFAGRADVFGAAHLLRRLLWPVMVVGVAASLASVVQGCQPNLVKTPITVQNESTGRVFIRLTTQDPAAFVDYEIPAHTELSVWPPNDPEDVRSLEVLDDACVPGSAILFGGEYQNWASVVGIVVESSGLLSVTEQRAASAPTATLTDRCRNAPQD